MAATGTTSDEDFLQTLANADEDRLIFTVCAMARTTGWRSGFRTLSDHVVWFITDGSVVGRIAGREVRVPAGTFHWIPAGVPHDLRCEEPGGVLRNHVLRFQVRRRGWALAPAWSRLALRPFARGKHGLEQLQFASQQPEARRFWQLRGLLTCLIAEALNHRDAAATKPTAAGVSAQRLDEFAARLGDRWRTGVRPADMAEFFGLSADYFTRCFQRQYGVSPREWLKRQRLRQAAVMLLESRLQVQEVAFELGFDDAHFFTRQFARHYGETPTAYRRRQGAG